MNAANYTDTLRANTSPRLPWRLLIVKVLVKRLPPRDRCERLVFFAAGAPAAAAAGVLTWLAIGWVPFELPVFLAAAGTLAIYWLAVVPLLARWQQRRVLSVEPATVVRARPEPPADPRRVVYGFREAGASCG